MHVRVLFEFVTKHRPDIVKKLYFYIPADTANAVKAGLTEDAARLFGSRIIDAPPETGWRSLKGVLSAVRSVKANHLLLLEIDSFIYSIAFRGFSVSGVWFRASYHYGAAIMYEGWRQQATGLLKRLTARILCSRHSVSQLFAFDPWAVEYAATRFKTGKVKYIPDPYAFAAISRGRSDPTNNNRMVFVIVGVIGRRKGILSVLGALHLISPRDQRRIELRIIGRVVETQRGIISSALDRARRETLVTIEQVDKFVSDEAIDAAIIDSDVLLLPYQRFAGSSGVLIRAALYGKPVLATKYGLIGALVNRHKLGLTLDPYDEKSIAEALSEVLASGGLALDKESASHFAAAHVPDRYAETLCGLIT